MCAVQNLANPSTWHPGFIHLWADLKFCPSIHLSETRKIRDNPQSGQQISVRRQTNRIPLNTNRCNVR
jgi:hypothetical protein